MSHAEANTNVNLDNSNMGIYVDGDTVDQGNGAHTKIKGKI